MNSQNRLAFIDSLRGFAALYVVIFHMCLVPDFKPVIPSAIRPVIMNGWTGVTLFFVISAFTLCLTLDQRKAERGSVLYFYLRRIFRIVPLYYLWFALMCLTHYGIHFLPALWDNKKVFLLYAVFGFNFVPNHQEGLVWASWTLGVEMVFYLFFPFLFKLCRSLPRVTAFFIISLLISWIHQKMTSNIPGYNAHVAFLSQLPIFLIGMICFFVYRDLNVQRWPKWLGHILTAGSGIAIIGVSYIPAQEFHYAVLYLTAVVYGTLLIGLCISSNRVVVNKSTMFLGLISYSLYLNHPRLIYYLGDVYRKIYSFNAHNTLSFLGCIFITLTALILVSYLTYKIIEEPGMNLGRMLIKRIKALKTSSG